jgi:hypothetical protein
MQSNQSNGESSTDTAPRDESEAFEVALRTLSERVRTDDAFHMNCTERFATCAGAAQTPTESPFR